MDDDSRHILAGVAVISVVVMMVMRRFRLGIVEFVLCALLLAVALASISRPCRETFDSAANVIRQTIMPSMDNIVKKLYVDEKVEKTEPITAARFRGRTGIDQLMVKYKRINYFLCNVRAADSKKYDDLMAHLGAGPPVYEETADDTAA